MMFPFTMLLHSLLLTILIPVVLGAPVSQGSTPPTLSLVSTISTVIKATDSLPESGVNRAKKAVLHLQGDRGANGSEISSKNRGTHVWDAHSALGTGVSISTGRLGWELGLNRANRMDDQYRGRRA